MIRPPKLIAASAVALRPGLAGGEPPEPPDGPAEARLVVIAGPDCGVAYRVADGHSTIGRDSSNEICLLGEGMSRTHATLTRDATGVTIRDNASTNGVYVNDERITETAIEHGDLIKVGRSILKLLASDDVDQAYHEEIYRLSTVDALTQVFNRRYFAHALERHWAHAERDQSSVGLILFDIDAFARCNETFGRRAGDHVLTRLCALVKARLRPKDILAREAGQRFAVLVPRADEAEAAELAEVIRSTAADATIEFEGREIAVSVGVGVCVLRVRGDDTSALTTGAQARLQDAKDAGGNRVVADPIAR
ncbi:MAG: diguanylate cyclase [Myxococcota bacterium]